MQKKGKRGSREVRKFRKSNKNVSCYQKRRGNKYRKNSTNNQFHKILDLSRGKEKKKSEASRFRKIAKVTRIFLVLKKDSVTNIVRIPRITNVMSIMLPSVPNIAVSCFFCNSCWLQPCQRSLCHLTLEVFFFLLNLLFIKKFFTLANLAIFVILSFLLQVKKSCYFWDSCDIRGFLEGLLCLSP